MVESCFGPEFVKFLPSCPKIIRTRLLIPGVSLTGNSSFLLYSVMAY